VGEALFLPLGDFFFGEAGGDFETFRFFFSFSFLSSLFSSLATNVSPSAAVLAMVFARFILDGDSSFLAFFAGEGDFFLGDAFLDLGEALFFAFLGESAPPCFSTNFEPSSVVLAIVLVRFNSAVSSPLDSSALALVAFFLVADFLLATGEDDAFLFLGAARLGDLLRPLASAFLDFTSVFLWRNLSASSAASVLAPFEMGDGAPALRSLRALAVTVFFVPLGIFYQRISDGYVLVS